MRSMVEGAVPRAVRGLAPSTAYRRSPSPAARERILEPQQPLGVAADDLRRGGVVEAGRHDVADRV